MTCIADANVLFPLLVDGHVAHDDADHWWRQQADDSVGLCLLTRLAVLRLLTNRVAMDGAPVSPADALAAWRQLAEDPRCVLIDTTPEHHEKIFARLVSGRPPSPNLWADAWLAALALALDHRMTTFDRGFLAFEGLQLDLLSVSA